MYVDTCTPVSGPPACGAGFTVSPHAHHHRLRKIELSKDALERFFAVADEIDVQNLEYVPYMRFALASTLASSVGPQFQECLRNILLDRDNGGFEIGLQHYRRDAASYVKFGTAVSYLIGPANHDAMSGKYYARFDIRDSDSSDSYLRQAYRRFTLHTDGTFVGENTDWLLMMKFAQENAQGGETRLLHLDDWEELETFSSAPMGYQSFVYRASGSKNVSAEVERHLFFDGAHGLSVSFIDQFVQPRTIAEALFLKQFSDAIEQSSAVFEMPLAVGSLLVINNQFWLHGRSAFEKHPALHRELMRLRGVFSA